jgi:uncharacterized protein
MVAAGSLGDAIDATPWVDTHEHLVEERSRLAPGGAVATGPEGTATAVPGDWSALLVDYAIHDLVCAGMPAQDAAMALGPELGPLEKWRLVEPWFAGARNTGHLRAADLSAERLCGAALGPDTCEEIDRRLRELRDEGYYAHVLRDAGVARCQVNSLEEDPFCETASPGLLDQDLSLVPLALGRHPRAEELSGIEVGDLADYLAVVDWCFETYAHRAVAAKCLWAYLRPLAAGPCGDAPDLAFRRLRRGEADAGERRQVEDFLLGRCLDLAADAGLPVKVHLGTLAGVDHPRLRDVFAHVAHITGLVQRHRSTTFVLMHMAWPQQEQLLALAKHQPNVVVDLCWAWSLAPRSTADFVQRFLTTAPATKLLCFGGDSVAVESVPGHAELARRGLQAALEGLVEQRWLRPDEALELVPLLMHGNAERVLPARVNTEQEALTP